MALGASRGAAFIMELVLRASFRRVSEVVVVEAFNVG